ncbi:enoyl-CoA hydratase/isomerase family protein [Flavobacterium sp. HSC-61S13]|uniref:enoyl-CoA hydratase/isomerase family protein n=1 Tax=Flavobacterium sp. HSC-61S13 TaxID=2910963 RepID=UPI0020A0EC18|nr:enoyl-CoA hydratase/isomerase family protein [Flavobacterium sp. HSC-61S13]MCP1996771.1 methylglutaconyl-CoA hydratase [Flavobacterium sp. HSC-61S13]
MNTNFTEGSIEVTREANVSRILFSHPASNSFPSSLLHALKDTINTLNDDNQITTVILESKGTGAFCAGASFDELLAIDNAAQGTAFFSGFALVINAIRKSNKIFIGRIHGKAVGGGVGLAAACDYCFATNNSAIKLSELAIGIGPFVIEPVVSKKIGKNAFTEMSLAAHEWKTADWALQKGLFAQLCESTEELDQKTAEFAQRISKYNPEALLEMKKIFWEGTAHWDQLLTERAAISGKLVLSDFTKKALNQFKKE